MKLPSTKKGATGYKNFATAKRHEMRDRLRPAGAIASAKRRRLRFAPPGSLPLAYKVDHLSRSLLDFSKIMETFDNHGVSFVSVTQQFNTTHSMGRLTLNILLSFAQFEREITGLPSRTRCCR